MKKKNMVILRMSVRSITSLLKLFRAKDVPAPLVKLSTLPSRSRWLLLIDSTDRERISFTTMAAFTVVIMTKGTMMLMMVSTSTILFAKRNHLLSVTHE